jgi:3-hydroxyisobutyrate dehydrogenase-like beta-hydroxyacid dehydrogenase
MDVGFIGVGGMGSGMAANLMQAGHQVTVYNRTPEKIAPLVLKGAKPAPSISAACRGDFIITMLADDDAVKAVTCGPDGIVANLSPRTSHLVQYDQRRALERPG